VSSDRLTSAGVSTGVDPGQLAVDVAGGSGEYEMRLRGELDMSTAPLLREEFQRLSAEVAPRVTVDLSGLGFVDSTGLSVLISALKRFRAEGGDMVLRAPTPSILRVLEITGLTEVFAIG
jgi:anti-sigma B factor antagonist